MSNLRGMFVGVFQEFREDILDFVHLVWYYSGLDGSMRYVLKNLRCSHHGKNKNIVRRIGSTLPFDPPNRYNFCFANKHLDDQEYTVEIEYLNSYNGDHMLTFEHANEDETINFSNRCQVDNARQSLTQRASTPISINKMIGIDCLSPTSISQPGDCENQVKITALEEELAKLRGQVAAIITTQEANYKIDFKDTTRNNESRKTNTGDDSILPSALTPYSKVSCPPPPPLPPSSQPTILCLKDQIKKNKRESLSNNVNASKKGELNTRKSVDLTEVLKGMENVKLKKVERSPGGTPVRKAPLQRQNDDPASLIAAALKRKFAKFNDVINESPDQENQQPWSPDSSPTVKYGHNSFHPVRKLSETFQTLSPLKEINVR